MKILLKFNTFLFIPCLTYFECKPRIFKRKTSIAPTRKLETKKKALRGNDLWHSWVKDQFEVSIIGIFIQFIFLEDELWFVFEQNEKYLMEFFSATIYQRAKIFGSSLSNGLEEKFHDHKNNWTGNPLNLMLKFFSRRWKFPSVCGFSERQPLN